MRKVKKRFKNKTQNHPVRRIKLTKRFKKDPRVFKLNNYIVFPNENIPRLMHEDTVFNINYKKIIEAIDMDDILKYFKQRFTEEDFEIKNDILDEATSTIPPQDYYLDNDFTKISPLNILTELLRSKGNLTQAAIVLKIRRDKLEAYILANPKVQRGVEIVNEMVIDFVESCLMDKVTEGDRSAIQYWLNTKAIHRGYGTYEQRRKVKNLIAGATGKINGDAPSFELE